MEHHFKLRVDLDRHDPSITLGVEKYNYVLETPTGVNPNPHIHYHLVSAFKRDTFVKRIKKLPEYSMEEVSSHGNGFYSLKKLTPDDDGYLRYDAYLCKQGPPTYVGYSTDECIDILNFQEKVTDEMAVAKKARRTQYQCIVDEYFSNAQDGFIGAIKVTELYCVECVVDYYHKERKLVREFMMLSLIQTLCLQYVPHYQRLFEDRLFANCGAKHHLRPELPPGCPRLSHILNPLAKEV